MSRPGPARGAGLQAGGAGARGSGQGHPPAVVALLQQAVHKREDGGMLGDGAAGCGGLRGRAAAAAPLPPAVAIAGGLVAAWAAAAWAAAAASRRRRRHRRRHRLERLPLRLQPLLPVGVAGQVGRLIVVPSALLPRQRLAVPALRRRRRRMGRGPGADWALPPVGRRGCQLAPRAAAVVAVQR